MAQKVLVIENELLMRSFLEEILRRKALHVTLAEDSKSSLSFFQKDDFDVVFLKLIDSADFKVLEKIKEISPSTAVVVITARGKIENALEAMQLGAFYYLVKPLSPDKVEAVIEKVQQQTSSKAPKKSGDSAKVLIANSALMRKIVEEANQIANSNANVMITGESGTGKEVIAHTIHSRSPRSHKSFIRVNCAAIAETLIESELFGHEKGAFTGAANRRLGRFELANQGTLLLDEITEISTALQAKLLRVIQEHEFERVGGEKSLRVDVRILSTSNRNLQQAIQDKILREDLYYRLNVIPIHLPPLRERRDDIIPLAYHFITKFCRENQKESKKLSLQAEKKLLSYYWPGNIRELANSIERAVVMSVKSTIEPELIYLENSAASSTEFPRGFTLKELEKRYIIETLKAQQNDHIETAKNLGISLRALESKLDSR